MTVYLYGLVLGRSAHLVPSHIAGIDASPLRVVSCDDEGLCALVSTIEGSLKRPSIDAIRAHDHALQSVVHHGSTAAAVRFGQTFASDAEIRRHVAERGAGVARALEAHDGCVEMRLLLDHRAERSRARDEERGDAGPGRAYLEHLRARDAAEQVDGLALREALGPIVRAERVERLTPRGVAFSHLIRRDDEPQYRSSVAALPALADVVIVGPLALYTFASAGK